MVDRVLVVVRGTRSRDPAMHAAALLSIDGWRSARLTGAGVFSMIAAHLIGLPLVGTFMGSDSPTILIAGIFRTTAGGGEALGAAS